MRALLRQTRRGLLVALAVSSLLGRAGAQTATNAAPTQVPAGSTAAIGQTKPAGTPPESKKILKDALSPETRKTLQDAMDATPAPK